MPRASGYLCRDGEETFFEDRFNVADLWCSHVIDGRWTDDDGRLFMLSTLREPPVYVDVEADVHQVSTRTAYESSVKCPEWRDKRRLVDAIAALSPIEIAEKGARPRQMPRGFKDVRYWQGTNETAIVCALLPEDDRVWRLAIWTLSEGDDFSEMLKKFEDEVFDRKFKLPAAKLETVKGERELLRRDARHSVSAYREWRVTDADEFSVLDSTGTSRDFVVTLTNDLKNMRALYAKTLPTGISTSNSLAVARIYGSRDDYLDALEVEGLTNMNWTAAYWAPSRRELVASIREGDTEELLRTVRHEAFHQYLSYATAFISVSPWLNEGYAQYFEHGMDSTFKATADEIDAYAKLLPPLLIMDYPEFYSGSDAERLLKYRLAETITVFIEKGAPLVRFQPFAKVKENYFKVLIKTQDMRLATAAAFPNRDFLDYFVNEWKRYWKNK